MVEDKNLDAVSIHTTNTEAAYHCVQPTASLRFTRQRAPLWESLPSRGELSLGEDALATADAFVTAMFLPQIFNELNISYLRTCSQLFNNHPLSEKRFI
jgi:hypothetical protein